MAKLDLELVCSLQAVDCAGRNVLAEGALCERNVETTTGNLLITDISTVDLNLSLIHI